MVTFMYFEYTYKIVEEKLSPWPHFLDENGQQCKKREKGLDLNDSVNTDVAATNIPGILVQSIMYSVNDL